MIIRLLPLIFLISSCSWFKKVSGSLDSTARVEGRLLEQDYATYRARLISRINYSSNFDLTSKENYSGITKINFHLKKSSPLTVDFNKGEVSKLVINDQNVSEIQYNQFFVSLPAEYLVPGENNVEITFKHRYSKTGTGLYRFVDPVDQKVYVYSDFEPYDANDMFPCFDQPDLKATYESRVLVPKDWTVVSSVKEDSVEPSGDHMEWYFPKSAKFSTYIFSLHAGPYKIWTSEVKTKHQVIPLRLLARQTVAKYVDPQEWFSTTKQGFVFFEDYFDYPYPYKKYDQVIVPDFNSGAMENVGAVTFNEDRYVPRGPKGEMQKFRLASVILHEMAHMWFGNLVTMKWWDDLWLNESFATYASVKALVGGTPYSYQQAWTYFLTYGKRSAYWTDQLVTTHPIVNSASDTQSAFANFDGITYGKGASVLKQLAFFIGEKEFQGGIANYFKKYANGNTTLPEFMKELAMSSSKDLVPWQNVWLEKPQVNTVKVNWRCVQNKVTEATLEQSYPEAYPTMRSHKTQIAVFKLVGATPQLVTSFPISYANTKTPVKELAGLNCRDLGFVYPNFGDMDYVKIDFDEQSLIFAKAYLSKFESPLMRAGLWQSFWMSVVDQKMTTTEFLDMALKNLSKENSPAVLALALDYTVRATTSLLPTDSDWASKKAKYRRQVSGLVSRGFKASADIDVQELWFNALLEIADQDRELSLLSSLLDRKPAWLKFEVDQDRRWEIVKSLNKNAFSNYKTLLAGEVKRDGSASGVKWALAVEASRPDLSAKRSLWRQALQNKEWSLGKKRAVLYSLYGDRRRRYDYYAGTQEALRKAFSEEYFKTVRESKEEPLEFLSALTSVIPTYCQAESLTKLKGFVEKNKDLPAPVLKQLKIAAQEDERCIGIREKAKGTKAL